MTVVSMNKNPSIERLVKYYVRKRDQIRSLEVKHAMEIGPENRRLEVCEQAITQYLNATKQMSARTVYGTATLVLKTKVSLSDKDAFMDYVRRNDAYELMERHAAKKPCLEFLEEHGKAPPGVNLSQYRTASVTKPTIAQSEQADRMIDIQEEIA